MKPRIWSEEYGTQDQKRPCVKCGTLFSGRRCMVCKKASDGAWKLANVERRKAVDAEWVKNNPEKVRATKQRYAERHPEKRKASKAKWQIENADRMRIHGQNRRARTVAAGGKLSIGLAEKLFKLQRGRCACCHADLTKKKPHLDHVIPVALGGPNSDENMQLLCYSCNQSKCAKHPIDFMQSRGFLL